MAFEFRLPDIGEGVAEGEVVKWFVREGDSIEEDAPLVSVLTDKANVEIPSPRKGKIAKLHAGVGEKVKVGGLLVTIDDGSGSVAAPASTHAASGPAASATPPSSAPTPSPASAGSPPVRALATPSVRRLAAEKGIDLATVKGSGPGGRITEADLTATAAAPAVVPAPSPVPAATTAAPPAAVSTPATSGAPPPAAAPSSSPGDERVPIRGLRRVIAEHMTQSVHTAAHFTYVEEVDASEMIHLRDRMAKHVEKHGVKLSYLPFIVKAVVAGLRAYPWMNATMDDAHQELIVRKEYNIGIAAATPDGLTVPVVHHADRKSVTDLAKEISDLGERARSGKLARAELMGGTFTITSLGALGGLLATPILNYPEVGILGVHRIIRRPSYRPDGSIGPVDLMNLSVSLDHRILDGIVGAQFLAVVKSNLEDLHQLFADLA